MEDVLVPIAGIVGAFSFPLFLLWVILEMRKANHRNKENMALISQGIIPETTVKPKATPNRFVSLRNGIVLVGIAVGILVLFSLYPSVPWNRLFDLLFRDTKHEAAIG